MDCQRSYGPVLGVALAVIVPALAACQHPMLDSAHAPPAGDPFFRHGAPRSSETIFSPLNLPTPDRVRTAAGVPGPDYWQQQADYTIEATLAQPEGADAETWTIDGHERIEYTNNSPEPLSFLWIHLEQNAFTDSSINSFMAGPEDRFGDHGAPNNGGFDLKYVRWVPRPDPHDDRPIGGPGPNVIDIPFHIYDTVARLDLPTAIPAAGGGGGVGGHPKGWIEIGWSFKVPPYGADRMGIYDAKDGPVLQIAQWFPALAVFDDVHGWNTLPYIGAGEFYTNIGSFDVKLTVPRDHLVAATGVLQNPEAVLTSTQIERLREAASSTETVTIRSEDEIADPTSRPAGPETFTWHFKADSVRTFAWASSHAFIWDAAACDLGPASGGAGGKPELAMSMYPREALPLWKQATEMLRTSIEHYSARWFRYPYPVATNINGIVGGMEYPMIIFCSDRDDEKGLFGVTTHEIGHNWFPMTVNTDERRHAWMDEGFNTFINYYAVHERYGGDDGRRGDAKEIVSSMLLPDQQPMEIAADQVRPGMLGTLEYAKTAAAMVLLREQVLGPERFDAAFRGYIKSWAFKSPQPADFFRCMENGAGEDLAWFWRGWFLETGMLDQAVESVEWSPQSGEAKITFTNRGELVMPIIYRVTYDDGTTEDHRVPVQVWFAFNRYTATLETDGLRPVKVEIDPEGVIPDVNTTNNVWTAPAETPR